MKINNTEIQYYSHLCACGCGGQIEIKKTHKYDGIPKYVNGHNETKGNLIHGWEGTKLYKKWKNMKNRCFNLKHKSYKDYGGRGITICNEWLEFIPFRDWAVNNGYKEGLQINRINNDGSYESSNCNFVTSAENCRNRNTTILTIELVKEIKYLWNTGRYTQEQLAKKFNVSQTQISNIINNKQWKK